MTSALRNVVTQMKSVSIFFLICLSLNAVSEELKPFTTDGCSMFPDGVINDDSKWVKCCIKHDLAYWKGGTESERDKADEDLKKCVADTGEEEISAVMHFGVKVGGSPVYPTWYRWGYGWPYNRGYKPLSDKENEQVKQRLMELRDLLDEAIK